MDREDGKDKGRERERGGMEEGEREKGGVREIEREGERDRDGWRGKEGGMEEGRHSKSVVNVTWRRLKHCSGFCCPVVFDWMPALPCTVPSNDKHH